MRDYLVFVRAGSRSLHPRLIAEDPSRNWDCCVSWYANAADDEQAEYYVQGGDNKLEAFAAYFRDTQAGTRYRYYLLLDDDIYFRPGDISRLFDLCQAHSLFLSQPALLWGTNSNHDVTLWNPVCRVRRTRFVEVMAPCFSRAAVERLLPTFTLNKSTWGVDYAWASLLQGEGRIAVVDSVRVDHTKPVSLGEGAFYAKLRSMGIDAVEEYRAIKSTYPGFGGLRSEPAGHIFTMPLPAFAGNALTRLFEKVKKHAHRRRMRALSSAKARA
ncbi:MAG: hypothetical protein AB1768_08990 [Pseudomonadota bacterium]